MASEANTSKELPKPGGKDPFWEYGENVSFLGAFTECLYKMYGNYPELQDRISSQLPLYQNKAGSFGREMAIRQMKSLSLDPVNWWQIHGITAPDLMKIATRILGLTTSSSGCERNWSVFEMIHTKKRNRLSHEKLNDLVYVKFNSQLNEKFEKRRGDHDPLDACTMEDGKVVEWINPPKASNVPCSDSDEDDEVFPGEKTTWRQVEIAMGVDPTPRSSSRVRASKKTKTTHGTSSSKVKGKRHMIEEDEGVWLFESSSSDSDAAHSESKKED